MIGQISILISKYGSLWSKIAIFFSGVCVLVDVITYQIEATRQSAIDLSEGQ